MMCYKCGSGMKDYITYYKCAFCNNKMQTLECDIEEAIELSKTYYAHRAKERSKSKQ